MRGSVQLVYIVWYFQFFLAFIYYSRWCYLHYIVLCFCLINLFIFHRAAHNLLEDFVGIYLDGKSSFLHATVDKEFSPLEVNVWFILSICKREICTVIICLYFINLLVVFSVHITMGTNSTCVPVNSHLMLCKTEG